MQTRTIRCALYVLVALLAAACGDDDFKPADSGPGKLDGPGKQDGAPGKDLTKPDAPPTGFNLMVTVDIDAKLKCPVTDKNKDCKGPLIWGVWAKPATDPNPGDPLRIWVEPDGKKGTVIKATNIPIAPKMYLNLFIDDNASVTPTNVLPDKGDLVHLDLDPFTATTNQTITRTVTLFARMP